MASVDEKSKLSFIIYLECVMLFLTPLPSNDFDSFGFASLSFAIFYSVVSQNGVCVKMAAEIRECVRDTNAAMIPSNNRR